jgi:hypothetical protein
VELVLCGAAILLLCMTLCNAVIALCDAFFVLYDAVI